MLQEKQHHAARFLGPADDNYTETRVGRLRQKR
jgi:hypothetical protein